MRLLQEFKPALLFLSKFVGFYLVANILYGLYIESWERRPDPITRVVTVHTSALLGLNADGISYADVSGAPKVALRESGDDILHIFEGCNGINVMIVFVAFVLAYGGRPLASVAFISGGLLILYLANLVRLAILFYLAWHESAQFYYFHKYVFTASLYGVVFALWAFWMYREHGNRSVEVA